MFDFSAGAEEALGAMLILLVGEVCLVMGMLAILFPSLQVGRRRMILAALVLTGLAVIGPICANPIQPELSPMGEQLLQAVTVLFAGLAFTGLLRVGSWQKWVLPSTLIAVGLALSGTLIARLEANESGNDCGLTELHGMEDLDLAFASLPQGIKVTTDQGRGVRLFNTYAKTGTVGEAIAKTRAQRLAIPLPEGVSVTGPADAAYNCYGWVFTGGRYFIGRTDVEAILHDNQYEIVEEPTPGDIIVYRDVADMIVHVGVVRATGTGNFVLIESKMGWMGRRLLHPPELQSYSQIYTYYRSPREGHLLAGLDCVPAKDEIQASATAE
jgi:hypothetical protein